MSYLTDSKAPLIAVTLCLVLSAVSNLAGSYLSSRIIINNLVSGAYASAGPFALDLAKLAAIYLAGIAAAYSQSAMMIRLGQKGTNRLRRELFAKLQELPLSYFDRHTRGELMSRFTNDADNVQMAMEQSAVSLLSGALTFAGIIAVMLYVSPILFFATILTLAANVTVFRVFGGRSRRHYRRQQTALGKLNGNIQEMIEGLRVVKAFAYEKRAKTVFRELNGAYQAAATNANFYSSAMMPMTMSIMNVGYAVTAAFGGLLAIVAGLDLGGFVLYLNLSKQISHPMSQVSQQLNNILSALAGAERIFELMDSDAETDQGSVTLVPAVRGEDGELARRTDGNRPSLWAWKAVRTDGSCELIEVKGDVRFFGVDFSYAEDKPVLKRVSAYAKPGQKIAFVGSTGAGKTTVTNLLNRFYEIDAGSITYDGIDIRDIKKDSLRRSLGMVLQDTHLFTGSVMDNIRYGRLDATDEECIAAARSANAHSFIRRLPQGYRTIVAGDGDNLSQGQRQLLAIARAAVADPPVMILDEATSSIDTRTERLIEKGMDALMENRTVFVIAHRLSTVRNADAILVIEGGEIIERGDHADLLAQKGRYYQLYTGQFELD